MFPKKQLLLLLLLLLTAGLGGLATRPSYAQTVTRDMVTFEQFGFLSRSLEGPFDNEQYFFSLPANWRLNEGVRLELDLDIQATVRDAQGANLLPRGKLTVLIGNNTIGTIPLDRNGRQVVSIEIPASALVPNTDGRYSLTLNLNSGTDCQLDSESLITVYNTSNFFLPHNLVPPELDLSLLPRPFYQRSFEPDAVTVVIPSEPTAAELQAAMTIMAGFGNLASGQLEMSLVTAAELPESLRLTKNLIFIGQPGAYPQLDEVAFVVPPTADGFAAAGAQPTDGLLQIALSPWNNAGVVLLVTGQDDNAIVMAAQAVSTGQVQVSRRRNLAVISSVRPEAFIGIISETERTFGQLGYGQTLLEGLGRDEQTIRFFVPFGQVAAGETYLDLTYLHSAILDYQLSGVTLRLNNDLMGSLLLTEATTQLTTTRLPFPSAALRPGVNEIRIESNLIPRDSCAGQNQDDLWFSIRPESKLFLPLTDGSAASLQILSLRQFPDPFVYEMTLGTTAMVVPQNDVQAWRTAAQIAFYLGDQANSPLVDLTVAYADSVPDALRLNHNLIIVGQPSQLPILQELATSLPVPFAPQSNEVVENWLPITYRLPRNAAVGYLELSPTPWNPLRSVVLVAGRNEEGLQYAADALLTSALRNQLIGDFASVVDTQVLALDSRAAVTAESPNFVPTPASVLEGETAAADRTTGAPDWVYPAMLGSVGLMGVVLVIALGQYLWGVIRRRRQTATS